MATTTSRAEALNEMVDAFNEAKQEWRADPATTEEERDLRAGERAACWDLMARTAQAEE